VHRRGLSNAGDDAVLVQVGQITAAALRKRTRSGRRTAHPWISRPAKLLSRLRIDMAWRPGLDPSNDRLSIRVSAATSGWTVTQTDAPTPMPALNTTSGSPRPATTVRTNRSSRSCIRSSVSPGPRIQQGFPCANHLPDHSGMSQSTKPLRTVRGRPVGLEISRAGQPPSRTCLRFSTNW
jgi:hypothetical protein